MNQRLFRDTAILFVVIGILDLLANILYLYWTTWWFDMALHFLSGGVVAMTVILFLSPVNKNKTRAFWYALLGTLIIGVLWEVFELHFDITSLGDGIAYWTDTSSDVFLDLLGGFLGMKYSLYVLNKNV